METVTKEKARVIEISNKISLLCCDIKNAKGLSRVLGCAVPDCGSTFDYDDLGDSFKAIGDILTPVIEDLEELASEIYHLEDKETNY